MLLNNNILLTSSGRRSYIVKYFKDALNGKGEVHASNSVWSPALQTADKSIITPLIYGEDYIDFLLKYCKINKITAIISLFDIDLPVLAKSKDIFKKQGIHVIVSDYKVTQVCNDKWSTYNFLKDNNIYTPKTFISLEKAFNAVNYSEVSFPLIVKPRWGMGTIGIYQADNKDELKIFYQKSKKEILKTYLKYESESEIENSIIIQEKITGQEYGLDVINDLNKNYITTLVKRKIAMRAGETDNAITEDNYVMRDLGRQISECLEHIAILDVDCFITDEGDPSVLEMNCRFGGHYPFSHLAGANIPLAIIKWLNKEIAPNELFQVGYGVEAIKDIHPKIFKRS